MHNENFTHDGLQAACFMWLWNTYACAKYATWANHGNAARNAIEGAKNRSKGHYKGVIDLFWLYRGTLYIFDCKLGKDYLKPKQRRFIQAMEAQGAVFFKVKTLTSFKEYVAKIAINEPVITKKW